MSFNEAFAAARHEVGPGGVFHWHDGVYGTYYANEWHGLSDAYKHEFSNYHYDNLPDTQYEEVVTVEAKVANDFAYIHEVPEGYDDVAIVNTEHIEFDREAVAVVSTNMNEQEMVFLDTDFDNSHDIAVVSDTAYSEEPSVFAGDDEDIIAFRPHNFDMNNEHLVDFHNNDDISNFV